MKLMEELQQYLDVLRAHIDHHYGDNWTHLHDFYFSYHRAKWIVERLDPFWQQFYEFERETGSPPRSITQYADWLLERHQKSQTKNS